MKLIIRQILIIFILISTIAKSRCEYDVERRRLGQILEKLNEKKIEHIEGVKYEFTRPHVDIDCAKNFFKLPQNQKMIVNEIEELVFIIAGRLKCSDGDHSVQFNITNFERDGMRHHLDCLKFHLQKLEPTSKLIQNFKISEDGITKCKRSIYIEEIEEYKDMIEQLVGPLSVFTCGVVTGANDYVKIIAKNALIKKGDISEELKETEMRKLKEHFNNIAFSTVKCIIKRYEDNPKAFLINDTLNHYIKKGIEPIRPETIQTGGFNFKSLIEVKNITDYQCVTEQLNLEKFGSTAFLKVEAAILIASAKSKCNNTGYKNLLKTLFGSLVEENDPSSTYVKCIKYHLQKLDPASNLVNYSNDGSEPMEDSCSSYATKIYFFRYIISKYEKAAGKLNQTTCGLFTDEYMTEISYKTIILSAEKNEEIKINEMDNFVTALIDKLHKLADCIYERVSQSE